MRADGTIRYLTNPNGGYEATNGDWIPQAPVWSDDIPCKISIGGGRLTKYQDGQNTSASFEILIEMRDFQESQIEIFQRGYSLGKFPVLRPNIKFLASVGRIKITV